MTRKSSAKRQTMLKAVDVYNLISVRLSESLGEVLRKTGVRFDVIFDAVYTLEDFAWRVLLPFRKERESEFSGNGSWSHFYSATLLSERNLYAERKTHALLFNTIKTFLPERVLEVGAGRGSFSIILLRDGVECVSLEINKNLATKIKESGKRFGVTTQNLVADAFHLPFKNSAFTVSLSQGMLEHFDNDKIKKLIREQLKVSRVCLFSVPSELLGKKDFGDERLLSMRYWQKHVGGHYTSYSEGKQILGMVHAKEHTAGNNPSYAWCRQK